MTIYKNELDDYFDFLTDNCIATEEEIKLVTSINGYNETTLNDILYVRTGYRSIEQYKECEVIED